MPTKCPCGQKYVLNHTMNCRTGGFVVVRHNARDFEANILKTIQNDIEIEPARQKIYNKRTDGHTGNEARPDIRARGVWRQGQNAFFDIRLTSVNNNSQKKANCWDNIKSTKRKEKGL